MIVRSLAGRCLLITQPDHADLARRAMEPCLALAGHPRRESILLATGEHDAAWAEEDASPRLDRETGEILDFIQVPLAVRQGVWPRTLARLASDPWAAALVAHHAATVYSRFRSEPAWAAFFAEMESARESLLRAASLPLVALAEDYPYVRLGDLISLTFCTGSTDEQSFHDWSIRLDGDHVGVSPDPFDGRRIVLEIAGRALPSRTYRSEDTLRSALREAQATTLRGTLGAARS